MNANQKKSKSTKNRGIGIQNATRTSGNVWEQFEEKDFYTTAEIILAVQSTVDMGNAVVISYPIPSNINGALQLSFFLFSRNKIDGFYHLMPPFTRIKSPINTYKEVEAINACPAKFNINAQSGESLGDINIVTRLRLFRDEVPCIDNVVRWRDELYLKMDQLLSIYPREPDTLNEIEKDTVTTYFELFVSLIQPPFLPAYRSLNPHFFDWLEAVLGYEVDPLLGPQNVATEYYVVDNIPVKLIPTMKGELEFFALNMQTGEFQRDMSYLPFFTTVSYDYIERVQHFTESQFDTYVSEVRKTISKQ